MRKGIIAGVAAVAIFLGIGVAVPHSYYRGSTPHNANATYYHDTPIR